jgi:hypothetical protein
MARKKFAISSSRGMVGRGLFLPTTGDFFVGDKLGGFSKPDLGRVPVCEIFCHLIA